MVTPALDSWLGLVDWNLVDQVGVTVLQLQPAR
jgi:hypothetical protein